MVLGRQRHPPSPTAGPPVTRGDVEIKVELGHTLRSLRFRPTGIERLNSEKADPIGRPSVVSYLSTAQKVSQQK